MLYSLFQCIACKSPLSEKEDRSSFPLCSICRNCLTPCPILCRNCGGPVCEQICTENTCSKPWLRRSSIESYSALYLLIDPGYRVLRKWKIHGGPLFDRQILLPNTSLLNTWSEFQADAVVNVPQNFSRAWKMGGSRTERLAEWVSKQIRVPKRKLLTIPQRRQTGRIASKKKRQAELNLEDRLQSRFDFQPNFRESYPARAIKRVILVDDFMTTGRTLDQAAKKLKSIGTESIHAFCLGIKTMRIDS